MPVCAVRQPTGLTEELRFNPKDLKFLRVTRHKHLECLSIAAAILGLHLLIEAVGTASIPCEAGLGQSHFPSSLRGRRSPEAYTPSHGWPHHRATRSFTTMYSPSRL